MKEDIRNVHVIRGPHRGGKNADAAVEDAVFRLACGYVVDVPKTYKLKHIEYEGGKKTAEWEELKEGVDQVHVPASAAAQKFWLTNRSPAWRDSEVMPEREQSCGVVELPRVEAEALPDEEGTK